MSEYRFEIPFVSLTFNGKPSKKFISGLYAIGIVLLLGWVFLFASVLPSFFGFETTVLIGIALLVLSTGDD